MQKRMSRSCRRIDLLHNGLCLDRCAASVIPLRGIVKGFYGTSWSDAAWMDAFFFEKNVGFKACLYALKEGPCHRAKWREPFPEEHLVRFGMLMREARAHDIRFVFAISSGLGIKLSGMARYSDRKRLMSKMEAIYVQSVQDALSLYTKEFSVISQKQKIESFCTQAMALHRGIHQRIHTGA